jgi:hypothetical protein
LEEIRARWQQRLERPCWDAVTLAIADAIRHGSRSASSTTVNTTEARRIGRRARSSWPTPAQKPSLNDCGPCSRISRSSP